MEESVENFVEVVASITMSKSLYFPVKDGMTKNELLEKAKKDITTPDRLVNLYKEALNHFGIRLNTMDIDLKDWIVDELEYITEYEETQSQDNILTE